jgi:hypothetical protein
VSEWKLTSWFECVCVSERELTSLPPFRPIKHRTNLANRISNEWTNTHTNPKPKRIPITLSDTHYGHTQEDIHYTEWYPLRTHPRRYPFHWVIPWLWVIPIPWGIFPLTKSSHNPPKSLPMTPKDLGFLTNKPDTEWYPLHWRIPLIVSYTHYPEFQPIGYPWHWVIPITLSSSQQDTPDNEWYPLPWVPANRIPLIMSDTHYPKFQPIGYRSDGQTDRLTIHSFIHSFSLFFPKMCEVNEKKNKRETALTAAQWTIHSFSPFFPKTCEINEK